MNLIEIKNAEKSVGPYSKAVCANGFVYTSGQIPLTAEGLLVDGTIEDQTDVVFANLKEVLEAAGSSLDRVVKATVFITDMNDFAKINEIYTKHFGEHKPARSCVEVSKLAMGVNVEIEVIALSNK
ncbi:RidA family protein [Sporosarcina siberiensis]|uniref:RidA family protein n=1 Tax=Sporosarcina siberiensis TaxID=1365606 RepID=A0ABW4SBH0_9BACL